VVISTPTAPLSVQAGKVKFELEDTGDANVTLIVTIEDVKTIHHVEPDEGSRTHWVELPAKRRYDCYVTIIAYKYGAQGPHYDSAVRVNGATMASTSGTVPQAEPSDDADASFALIAG
jgi:hypothetical protein